MSEPILSATLFGAEDLRVVETRPGPLAPGMVRVRFGAGGIWFSAFVMCFLPVEMRNRQMF